MINEGESIKEYHEIEEDINKNKIFKTIQDIIVTLYDEKVIDFLKGINHPFKVFRNHIFYEKE